MIKILENLQQLNESHKQTVDDLFEDIASEIQERLGCDIDDTWYDTDNYPEEFRAQLVLYNVTYEMCEEAEKIIKETLSNYENIKVNMYEDDKYEIDNIDVAYTIQINAFHDDFDFNY